MTRRWLSQDMKTVQHLVQAAPSFQGISMNATIYHNPACGTSRNVLAALRSAGLEVEVIEYLKTPPSRETIMALVAGMGITLRDVLRQKGTLYSKLGLDNPGLSDDALLDAIAAHPILLNRPIVVTDKGARLCRPVETVQDLLPTAR